MSTAQPLFHTPVTHMKMAGYKLPTNPRLWQSEIIRYLKSQHPYLPLENAEIDMRRIDANKGAAVGSVIIDRKAAVPIIISRPRPGADPELAPMDVFFNEGRYQFLDPDTIRHVIHTPQIGQAEKGRTSAATGGNPYVGDMTGDATPLEYSGQASPFAGPFSGTKTGSLWLPRELMKEAVGSIEKMKDRAALFGTTGAIGGALRGAADAKGRGVKAKIVSSLARALRDSAIGAGAGAGSVPVIKAIGLEKKQKKQQAKVIKDVVKKELEKSSALNPEYYTRGIDHVLVNGLSAGLIKSAYLNPNDINNFRQLLATNPKIMQGLGSNHELVDLVIRRGPNTPGTKLNIVNPNVVQVFKERGQTYIKFTGGPEQKTDDRELMKIFGDRYPEIKSKLKSSDLFMEHDGVQQASWNADRPPNESKLITSDGMYMVRTKDGESMVGMVSPTMIHLDGQTLPLRLFVTADGRYAVAGELYGVKLMSRHRLPSHPPASGQTGVFVNYVHGTPIATVPLRVTGVSHIAAEGKRERTLYKVVDPVSGKKFTLVPVQGVQGFERMDVVEKTVESFAEGQIYYVPADSEFVRLRVPVKVADGADELKKLSSHDSGNVHVTYASGLFHVYGVFEKDAFIGTGIKMLGKAVKNPSGFAKGVSNVVKNKGAGFAAKKYAPVAAVAGAPVAAGYVMGKNSSWQNLSEPEAREILVGMGVSDSDDVQSILGAAREKSGEDRGVKLAGLHPPQLRGAGWEEPVEIAYDEETVLYARDLRPSTELLKAAADSSHPETLDSILSLEFITPQNMRYFVDNVADLEETVSRLAALLIAIRLGMPHIPEEPVRESLAGMSKIVSKLKILKSAMDHKNEQAVSAT